MSINTNSFRKLIVIVVLSVSMLGSVPPAYADAATCKKLADAVARWENAVRERTKTYEALARIPDTRPEERAATAKSIRSAEKSLGDARKREVNYSGRC